MMVSESADSVREPNMISKTLKNRMVGTASTAIESNAVAHRFYAVEYDLPQAPGCRGHICAASRDHALAVIDRYVGLTRAQIVSLKMHANRGVRLLSLPTPKASGERKRGRVNSRRLAPTGAAA